MSRESPELGPNPPESGDPPSEVLLGASGLDSLLAGPKCSKCGGSGVLEEEEPNWTMTSMCGCRTAPLYTTYIEAPEPEETPQEGGSCPKCGGSGLVRITWPGSVVGPSLGLCCCRHPLGW